MHHPGIKSVNAKCPSCELVFGYVAESGRIECPFCHTTQTLPVILTDCGECFCTRCKTTFVPETTPGSACLGCGAKLQINPSPT